MSKRIKLLFLAANPTDVGCKLRLDEEIHQIGTSIRGSGRDSLKLVSEWAVRPNDLQYALLKYRPHIVHLSGHASKEFGIILEREDVLKTSSSEEMELEKSRGIRVQPLASLFYALRGNIQLVFLNLCYMKNQAKAISQFIDYTIGINTVIGDQSAIVLASSFYGHLAFGLSVKTSFDLAVNNLELQNLPGAKSPFIYAKGGKPVSTDYIIKSQSEEDTSQRLSSPPVTRSITSLTSDSPRQVKGKKKEKEEKKETRL